MKQIIFVAKINEMRVSKTVHYPDGTPDKEIDSDYKDWLDSVNKGYWEEV